MHNTGFCIYLLLIVVVVFTSCGCTGTKGQIRKTLLNFESVEVRLPQSLIEVWGNTIKTYDPRSDSRLKFVVFFAPYECSDCAIAHLMEYKPLFHLSEESGSFYPIILFSPDPGSVQSLFRKLAESELPFPIYVDQDQVMQEIDIPRDRLFHSFLIGRNEKPIYIGTPLGNETSRRLFFDVIRTEQDNKANHINSIKK